MFKCWFLESACRTKSPTSFHFLIDDDMTMVWSSPSHSILNGAPLSPSQANMQVEAPWLRRIISGYMRLCVFESTAHATARTNPTRIVDPKFSLSLPVSHSASTCAAPQSILTPAFNHSPDPQTNWLNNHWKLRLRRRVRTWRPGASRTATVKMATPWWCCGTLSAMKKCLSRRASG